ncbi:MAG TPA: hypothetical protein ENN22_08660 [bacterium]|nr:hypothetical protein [bacterium]
MFLKSPKIRQFDFKPRYYQPDDQPDESQPRIQFRRLKQRRSVPKRSFWGMIIMIIILIFLIRYLAGLVDSENQNRQMQEIRIEVIN